MSAAPAARLATLLTERKLTLSVAESCTGGMFGAAVTTVPGASAFFLGGVIAYSNHVKTAVLGVPKGHLSRHGAVSREVARSMAQRVRAMTGSNCSIAVTGIAGPGGGSRPKPVGLVYIAVSIPTATSVDEYRFTGTRERIRRQAVQEGLAQMCRALERAAAPGRPG